MAAGARAVDSHPNVVARQRSRVLLGARGLRCGLDAADGRVGAAAGLPPKIGFDEAWVKFIIQIEIDDGLVVRDAVDAHRLVCGGLSALSGVFELAGLRPVRSTRSGAPSSRTTAKESL